MSYAPIPSNFSGGSIRPPSDDRVNPSKMSHGQSNFKSELTLWERFRCFFSFGNATREQIENKKIENRKIEVIAGHYSITTAEATKIFSYIKSDNSLGFQSNLSFTDSNKKLIIKIDQIFQSNFSRYFSADVKVIAYQRKFDELQKNRDNDLELSDESIKILHATNIFLLSLVEKRRNSVDFDDVDLITSQIDKNKELIESSKRHRLEIAQARTELEVAKSQAASIRGIKPKGNTGSTGSKILRALGKSDSSSLKTENVGIFKSFKQPESLAPTRQVEITVKDDILEIVRPSKLQPQSSDPTVTFGPFIEFIVAAFFTEFGGDGFDVIVPTSLTQIDGEYGSLQVFENGREAHEFIDSIFKARNPSSKELLRYQKFLIMDYMLGNMDRHNRNWLIEVDQETGEIKRIIPIDHEKCLPIEHILRTWQYAAIDRNQYAPHRDIPWSKIAAIDEVKSWSRDQFSEESIHSFFDRCAKTLRVYCDSQPDGSKKAELNNYLNEFLKSKKQIIDLMFLRLRGVNKVLHANDGLNKLADLKTDAEIEKYVNSPPKTASATKERFSFLDGIFQTLASLASRWSFFP